MSNLQKIPELIEASLAYDISFTKNKDHQLQQFMVATLNHKSHQIEASYNDYTKKFSAKDLLAKLMQISHLPEADDVKYHFKLLTLMIIMGNATQEKYEINVLGMFASRLAQQSSTKNNLYVAVRNILTEILFAENNIAKKIVRETHLHHALAGVIKKLKTACQSPESKNLYAEMMLKFLHVKDVTFKDSITLKLGEHENAISQAKP